jgi:uncharacterized protein (DUF1778 family)
VYSAVGYEVHVRPAIHRDRTVPESGQESLGFLTNFICCLGCPDIVCHILNIHPSKKGLAMQLEPEPKSERIDIRTTLRIKRTLQDAATASCKTVSEFLLDSALTRAAEVLADQRLFLLNDEQWDAFWDALDAPSPPMPRLEKLLREPSVIEKAVHP